MCRAEVTGSLVPTVAKQMQSVEPWTDRTGCGVWVKQQSLAVTQWSDSVESRSCDSLGAAAKNDEQHKKNLPPRMSAGDSDLPGWFRCEGSRGTEFPPDSWGPRRRPAASSRRGRGWSRWTCHPLRHTPPWEGEGELISHQVDGGALVVEPATEVYWKRTKFNRLFIKCFMRHPGLRRGFFLTSPTKCAHFVFHLPKIDQNRKLHRKTKRRKGAL